MALSQVELREKNGLVINDRLKWPSTARRKPRNCKQGTVFDLDTTPSDTSDSSRENSDGNYKTDSTEADANGLARLNEVREDIPQITQGPEVYVSHRWSRPAGEKLNKRAVQSRQVTNVKKLGAVYSVIGDEETGDTRRNNSSHKRRLDENKSSIPTEEEKAPETFAEAAETKVWRDSMTAAAKQRVLESVS